jgi:actin related protein 2/3 complex subunit 1A/1B
MACLDVKWSPDGEKFAVASGSKKALIAFYEASNNWWVARECRKHKSTVLAVAWHPSSQLIATVATDYVCRVSSAYIEGVDAAPVATPFGPLPEVGEIVTEFEVTRAWLNDCAWSPCGSALAFVGHDALLHVATFNPATPGAPPTIQTVKCPTLPATRILFLSPTALVTAGHSMNPELFTCTSSAEKGAGGAQPPTWSFASYLDKKPDAGASAKATTGIAAARAMFANRVSKGQSAGSPDTEVWTKHHNAIVGIKGYNSLNKRERPPHVFCAT